MLMYAKVTLHILLLPVEKLMVFFSPRPPGEMVTATLLFGTKPLWAGLSWGSPVLEVLMLPPAEIPPRRNTRGRGVHPRHTPKARWWVPGASYSEDVQLGRWECPREEDLGTPGWRPACCFAPLQHLRLWGWLWVSAQPGYPPSDLSKHMVLFNLANWGVAKDGHSFSYMPTTPPNRIFIEQTIGTGFAFWKKKNKKQKTTPLLLS